MSWNPDSISPAQLNDLRHAAEEAWGDDTRNEQFVGHPQPSHGQCYVTSAWLAKRLGGYVGTKNGHFFWVSPDKTHIIDLTGDWFAYPPVHESRQTPDDEGHHSRWRPGPTMYKRASHSLWKGFRILPDYPDHLRATLFARRADAALRGDRVRTSDAMGDAYQGDTPQKQEDWAMGAPQGDVPFLHDEPGFDPVADITTQEYQFVVANGQVHVSPMHSHEDLFSHAGQNPASTGPTAVGYVNVAQNHATWAVESNMSMRGLHQMLSDYSDTVGWKFEGMVGTNGAPIHDDFGPKKSMWYRIRNDGHMELAATPLMGAKQIRIEGKTAYVGDIHEGLQEWAQDFGYKLAEYPGGGDVHDRMKNKENLDIFNRGDTDFQPERSNPDQDLGDSLICGTCGEQFESSAALNLHYNEFHKPQDAEEIPEERFPMLDDFDAPLPFRRTQPNPNGGETIAMVLPGYRTAARHPRFDLYASLFDFNHDEGLRFYGAFRHGQMVGYGAVRLNTEPEPEVLMIDALEHRSGIGTAILGLIQQQFDHFYTHADSEGGERLMRRMGMANVSGHRWRWSKGDQPKDMIEDPIPFIYDIEGDGNNRHGMIHIGYPGQQTHDVVHKDGGRFTPGGIAEGYYEPGGKVVLISAANIPFTYRHFANLWYHLFPQMEITSIERETSAGKPHKVAAENVGQTVRALVASDQAASNAYRALREAGGQVSAVGGVVRDVIGNRGHNDIDLMVAGLPAEEVDHVLSGLKGTVDLTGKRFGVYRYKIGGQEVEVALPRQDKYESARRGEGVITVDHKLPIAKDLERRDFTANSMAVDLDTGALIDPHGGSRDIEANVLRTTHPDSFREDPTRIVRALTMHGRFGLNPDERTRHEMETNGHLLQGESPDALNQTLDKLFSSHNPAGALRLAQETGVLQHLFPEVAQNWDFDQNNSHHNYPLGQHLLNVLDGVAQQTTDPDVRMAALYHDVGKPASEWKDLDGVSHYYEYHSQAHHPIPGDPYGYKGDNLLWEKAKQLGRPLTADESVLGANHEIVGARMVNDRMTAFNYPKARINRVTALVQNHMFPAFNTQRGARRFLGNVGEDADDLLTLRQADMTGKGQTPEEIAARTSVDKMRELVGQVRTQQQPTDLANLSVNGNDIVAMGVQGPAVGAILRALVNDVIDDPTLNDRNLLLQRAQQYANAQPSA